MHRECFDCGTDGSLVFSVDSSVYRVEAIVAAAHLFSDTCSINLTTEGAVIVVHIMPKDHGVEPKKLFWGFHDVLLDQQLRAQLREETGEIERMIVSEAFAPFEEGSGKLGGE